MFVHSQTVGSRDSGPAVGLSSGDSAADPPSADDGPPGPIVGANRSASVPGEICSEKPSFRRNRITFADGFLWVPHLTEGPLKT